MPISWLVILQQKTSGFRVTDYTNDSRKRSHFFGETGGF
jgi:hypothetical protein